MLPVDHEKNGASYLYFRLAEPPGGIGGVNLPPHTSSTLTKDLQSVNMPNQRDDIKLNIGKQRGLGI